MDSGSQEKSKRETRSEKVNDTGRNERQKTMLLVEYSHILGDISKELIEDSRDLIETTKKLIAKSKKSIDKIKSA